MPKMGFKSILAILTVFTLYTCIEPFNPTLSGSESILVVDGLITDANSSFSVRLSRTVPSQDSDPVLVSGAAVSISDNTGQTSYLMYSGNGTYRTDSLQFRGSAGRTYILHIQTAEGEEYESEPAIMNPVASIDSLYFEKDYELVNNGSTSLDGIRIFLDSEAGEADAHYRWDFIETWKFMVPDPKKWDYLDERTIVPHQPVNKFCWKNHSSDEILTRSGYSGNAQGLRRVPLLFVAPDQTDRLLIKYSVLVRQYSISIQDFDFWNNIKQVSESGNDIFGSQPYTVTGNVHNTRNPDEMVLGYFQVSAVKERRIFIAVNEIGGQGFHFFQYPECERIEKSPADYPFPMSWNDIYSMYCLTSDYYFVEPLYDPTNVNLEKLIFTRPECADCTLTGNPEKPDFWTD